jgi:hypothetical protein
MINFFGPGTALTSSGVAAVLAPATLGQPELWSVLSVETSGCGYLADRRPKILFERHIFSRLTGHQFDADDSDISQPTSGGYGPSGAHQYDRLNAAMQLDASVALKSASWGLGQIMGENYHDAGYTSVESMVSDMVASEDNHLRAMVNFIGAQGLIGPLMEHNWASFARRYNGPNYAANNYDGLLGHFYSQYSAGAMPDLNVRTAQIYLRYLKYSIGAIDGVPGPATRVSVLAFQAKSGMAQTGAIDDALMAALKSALGL